MSVSNIAKRILVLVDVRMIITKIASPTLEMLQDAMVMVHTNAIIDQKHDVRFKFHL